METIILSRAKHIMITLAKTPSTLAEFGGGYFKLLKVKHIIHRKPQYSINFTYTADTASLNHYSHMSIGSLTTICDICTSVAIFAGDREGRTTVCNDIRYPQL